MKRIESIESLKSKDRPSLKRSIETWRSKAEQAHKMLPKLVYAYTRDVEEGMIADTVRDELGFDLRSEIQHLYQLRNIVAAIDTGRTKLAEQDYDRISNSALVAFHKHLCGDHEEEAIEILRTGYKVKDKLRDLGKLAPAPSPASEESSLPPRVVHPASPSVSADSPSGPTPKSAPESASVSQPAAETEDSDLPSIQPSPVPEEGAAEEGAAPAIEAAPGRQPDSLELNILSSAMWLRLADQLDELNQAELERVSVILAGFTEEVESRRASNEAA